ncbi:MAG: outer membrane protein assembly factor BamD [Lentisphaerae bacterium]|nr:outer membrane protein assembly factor BamD [Lentisphaerota bacterium]
MKMSALLKTASAFLLISGAALFADDRSAAEAYSAGHAMYQNRDFYNAAKKFEESGRLATSPAIKANSLVARVGAWRMCGMIYRELECIDVLLSRYPEYADYKLLSERLYEIGDLYYNGQREPAYWHFRWIPWLNNGDKTADIYKKALERAPFSPSAARARLRLAYLLDQNGDIKGSIEHLRVIVKDFPKSKEYRYSILALAEALFIRAEHGDGDGRLAKEAYEMLKLYEKKYPKTSEMAWVKRRILQYQDTQAQRLYEMAEFYEKHNRKEASKRYYSNIISQYPLSQLAPQAEHKLIALDPAFTPGKFRQEPDSRLPQLRAYKIPQEASRVLISPATDRNTHFLRPVMDLKGPEVTRIEPDTKKEEKKGSK